MKHKSKELKEFKEYEKGKEWIEEDSLDTIPAEVRAFHQAISKNYVEISPMERLHNIKIEKVETDDPIPTEWNFLNDIEISKNFVEGKDWINQPQLDTIPAEVRAFHLSTSKNFIEIDVPKEKEIDVPKEIIKEIVAPKEKEIIKEIVAPKEKEIIKEIVEPGLVTLASKAISSNPPKKKIIVEATEQLTARIAQLEQNLAHIGRGMMAPGSGEVRLEFLDDVNRDSVKVDGKFLKYEAATGKWIGADVHTHSSNTYITIPNWYQTYASPGSGNTAEGSQIDTLTPTFTTGPWNYGTTLARGEEVLFDQTSTGHVRWIGIWGGAATYNTSEAGSATYWTKHIRFKSNMVSSSGTTRTITKGFDQVGDYDVTQSLTKYALVYDYATLKLKLYERHTGVAAEQRTLITTASVAEDGNPIMLSCAYENSGTDLPDFTLRENEWHIIAELNDGADLSWQDGTETGTVMRHGTGLHIGEKMVITTPAVWKQHFFGFDYTGSVLGQTNVANSTTSAFRCNDNEKMAGHIGWTINTDATRYDSGTDTEVMNGAKISIRYHLDNSVDIFDEDNEDILFTKDADMDGSVLYLHTFFSTVINAADATVWLRNWEFERFAAAWYGHPENKYKPNVRYPGATIDGAGRYIRGEKMYPGQEVQWSYDQDANYTYIGVRSSDDNIWSNNKAVKLSKTKFLLSDSTGWDSTTDYTATNKIFAIRYDVIDYKLKLYDVTVAGVETLVTTASVAEDGNSIYLSISGSGTKPVIGSVRYYGWEYVHLPSEYSQPWKNWRLNRPTANSKINQNTVLRNRRALIPGKAMRWVTPQSGTSKYYGVWLTTNPSFSDSDVDSNLDYWDWGFGMNNDEEVIELDQMTFNTSNPNYSNSPANWEDPDKGNTLIQIRYNADNSIDLHDATNSQVIATKNVDGDGSPIYISVGVGTNETNIADNFMGGGDVTFVSL